MDITLFLAKAFAIFLVVIGLAMFMGRTRFISEYSAVIEDKPAFFVLGLLMLILGIVLVLLHNVWIANWTIIITILAWLVLVRGLMRMFIPSLDKLVKKIIKQQDVYYLVCLVLILLGLYLGYMGFVV
ncbi:MAG: hypothetical protein ACE365_00605 [Gammaproteobacteria bacterium]